MDEKFIKQLGFAPVLLISLLAAVVIAAGVLFSFVKNTYFPNLHSNSLSKLYPKSEVHAASSSPQLMPVISRGVKAFASSGLATDANDSDYSTYWAGTTTSWLAYDLSTVPAANRGQVVAAWYNDPVTTDYWQGGGIGNSYYNLPSNYTIEANAAAGGSPSAPATGWVNLVTVTGNVYNGRMHRLDLTGYNWVRFSTTASKGGAPYLEMDIHDASLGVEDSYLMLGDSITAEGAAHSNINGGPWKGGNLSQLINASSSAYFPSIVDGGTGGVTTSWAATYIDSLLAPFSGHFVTLNYGTNDANDLSLLTIDQIQSYYTNMLKLVDAVQLRGMVAIVPHIPWGCASGGKLGANAKTLNDYMDAHLYLDRPGVIKGPDLWTFFNNNRSLIRDCIHPTYTSTGGTLNGYEQWQRQWRDALMANVYNGAPLPSPTATPIPSPTPTPLPVGDGLSGNYFNNMTLTDPAVLSRVDATVNFNWSSGSPLAGIVNINNFSARWTGYLMPKYSQTYTFCVASNDGARLWVDNVLVVDFWFNQSSAIQHCGNIALQANTKFPVKLEYYENTGNAVAKLYWQSTSQVKQIIPKAKLFSN